jgi:hypothetical protein
VLEGQAWWEWLYFSGAALPGVAALAELLSPAAVGGPRMRELERLEIRCRRERWVGGRGERGAEAERDQAARDKRARWGGGG